MTDTENPKDALGVKKAALRFVPHALRLLAIPAMSLGAKKYGPMNWRTKAVKLSVYLEALQRHIAAYEDGQDNDPESGASHLSHAAACLGIIADAQALGMLVDDRMTAGPAAALLADLDRSLEVSETAWVPPSGKQTGVDIRRAWEDYYKQAGERSIHTPGPTMQQVLARRIVPEPPKRPESVYDGGF